MQRPLQTYLLLFFITLGFTAGAQNLGTIGKENPLSVTGGVSLSQVFYAASGIQSRRDPYTYIASGNVNFSLYGWSVPLSFTVSNQNTSFQQPFNQYSLHPTYKSITGHAGFISMSYSPYTVNGHIFLGGAVDVAPQDSKWKFSGLYGRFLRAVELDTLSKNAVPSYKRMGYGFKAGFSDAGSTVDLVLFRAKDEVNSIRYVPDSLGFLPQENLVVSISAGKTFFEHFTLKGEIANSAITRDARAEETNNKNLLARTGFLYTPRVSSSYYKAIKASLNYQFDVYTVGLGYERIDPQYRTLGSYYFNNDLESLSANLGASILHGKLNLAVSAGSQHDNLDKSKISTMARIVGSANVNYIPSQKLNLSASYSTFQTYTNIRPQFLSINQTSPLTQLDTLNYTQISKNATLTAMYGLGSSKQRRQSVNLNLSFQNADDKQEGNQKNAGTQFYNVNASYALNITPKNLTVSVAFNSSFNESPGYNTKTLGPTASVSKSFLDKKFRTTLSSSYNNTYNNAQRVNTIVNGRLNGTYSIKKKHNFNMGLVVVNRESKTETTSRSFTEFTGTLGYGYSFGIGGK